MKRTIFIILVIALLAPQCIQAQQTPCPAMTAGTSGPATAAGQMQMQNQPGPRQGMMQGDMMQMCTPMMNHMMRHSQVINEMLQLMKDIIRVEQRLARGISAGERNAVVTELDLKIQRLDRLMDEVRAGMVQPAPGNAPGPAPIAPSGHAH